MTVMTKPRTDVDTPTTTTRTPAPTTTAKPSRPSAPRASMMATLSLILGVVAALTVMTGLLVRPGIGLGLVASLVAVGGLAATRRKQLAGRADSVLGLLLGLAAMIGGVMVATGASTWLATDTDYVMRVHDWLQAHLSWLI